MEEKDMDKSWKWDCKLQVSRENYFYIPDRF